MKKILIAALLALVLAAPSSYGAGEAFNSYGNTTMTTGDVLLFYRAGTGLKNVLANNMGTITGVLGSATTATTQSALDSSTKIATTKYTDDAVAAGTAQATNTVLGNATSGSAAPTALPVASCSTAGSALKWTTNTGFGCNSSITAAAAPASGITGTTLASNVVTSSITSFGASPALGTPATGDMRNTTHIPTKLAPGFTSTSPVTGQQGAYWFAPCSGTITGYAIAADAGTATVTTWKIASGTTSPTVSNSISTSGVSLSSGTAIISSTTSDFTTTTVSLNDIFAFNVSAVATATKLTFQLFITCN